VKEQLDHDGAGFGCTVLAPRDLNSMANDYQNRNTPRNLLPNCYQNMASGLGAESWGIGLFIIILIIACAGTEKPRVRDF
jgi:hypothetical protein